MAVLGVDVGTTACKAVVFDKMGEQIAQARKEYKRLTPKEGWAEIDPEDMWNAVKYCIYKACTEINGQIDAIAISSHGEGVIPLGKGGKPIGNEIISYDLRSVEEAEILRKRFGTKYFFDKGGQLLSAMGTVTKIQWMCNHTEHYSDSPSLFVCAGDFIGMCLTGRRVMDYSLAARTMLFEINSKCWNEELLEFIGLTRTQLSEVVQAGQLIGPVLKEVAEELKLEKHVLVVVGGHDQPCSMLGAGAVRSDEAAYSLGTTETLVCGFTEFVPKLYEMGLPCYPDVIAGRYITLPGNFTGGNLLEWFKNSFVQEEHVDAYGMLMEEMSEKPSNLLVLPHFTATGSPWNDSCSKGMITGLSFDTTRGQYVRGLQEGVTFEILLNMVMLQQLHVKVDRLIVSGGGTASSKLLQMKADILGKKLIVSTVRETACKGAALLASYGIGQVIDVREGFGNSMKEGACFVPNQVYHAYYMEQFERYKKMYPFIKEIYSS